MLARDGKEAALAAADPNAAAEAEKDRQALLDDKGADANQAAQRIELIHRESNDPKRWARRPCLTRAT